MSNERPPRGPLRPVREVDQQARRSPAGVRVLAASNDRDGRGGDDVNQGDLADAVAGAIGVKKAEAVRIVTAVLGAIRDGLKRGEKVAISGFGSFETARR